MTGMFSVLKEKVPKFKKYNEYLYKRIILRAGSKVVLFKLLWAELFNPTDKDNQATTPIIKKLGKITSVTFIDEFNDTTKVTCEHLSELEGRLLFGYCTTEGKDALVGMREINDVAESSILSFTEQLIST